MKTVREKVDVVVAGGGTAGHVALTVEHGAVPV